MERAARLESKSSDSKDSRRRALIAAAALLVTGVALAAVFFPLMFNRWLPRDDEGVFTYGLREFLSNHGHLYSTIWSDLYGPFYYLFMSTVFRVIHQQPSLENGRWIVLTLTTATAALLGGAVWKVTKSVPTSIVAEVAGFMLLIPIAGNEPMHPGSLEVFLVAVVAFELASYAASRRTLHLVATGVATGALMMTKVNAGGLVAVAIVFGLVVGNRRMPRWIQIVVAAATALVPAALVSQHIWDTWADTFALLVIGSIVGMFVVTSVDPLTIRRFSLVPLAGGAAAAVVCSLVFPLVTGTPLSDVIDGVFIRPLKFSSGFAGPATVGLDWLSFVLTVVGIGAAVAFKSFAPEKVRAQANWVHAVLAAFALWILGLGVTTYAVGYVSARWLPILVVLPAFAFCCRASEPIRFALRLTVLLAALQILVAYPVAGSQIGWGTAAMVVPCGIALAAGIDYARFWREAGLWLQGGATAFVCVAIIVATANLPTANWKAYVDSSNLGLPGTGLMRVDPTVAATLQGVARQLRKHCDTFYGVPNLNSFYIFSGLPAVTGMVANGGPAGLTADQQLQVVDALRAKESAGERVCILRDGSVTALVPGPLTDVLNLYAKPVATVGTYTISRRFSFG